MYSFAVKGSLVMKKPCPVKNCVMLVCFDLGMDTGPLFKGKFFTLLAMLVLLCLLSVGPDQKVFDAMGSSLQAIIVF